MLVAFVLVLASTGIVLNHIDELGLDQRHVRWSWLLDAYGIQAPPPAASFADGDLRATLLGTHLYVGSAPIAADVAALAGIVSVHPLVLVATDRAAYILTSDGELVEVIDLEVYLPGTIERVGRAGERVVLQSAGHLFRSDPAITVFDRWDGDGRDVRWSDASAPGASELRSVQAAYRGAGLTVERVLLDLHSGRILSRAGPWIMDFAAIGMIVLGLTGLSMSTRRGRRENGRRR